MNTVRCFIAIPLPEALCQQLVTLQQNLRRDMPELRPGAPHNLHLTLKFLGDQSEEQLAKISQFMLSVVVTQTPFSLNLKGLGTFPESKRPRILWLGMQPPEPLVTLQQMLSAGLAKLGCPEERKPYRPHLTLGRFRQPPASIEALDKQQNNNFDPLPVESIILYSSRLTPQGVVHHPLTVAKFQSH